MNSFFFTAVIFVVVCELAGIAGSVFTARAIPTWYKKLTKPSFSPPNWLFGPVWTVLYLLMGIAGALLWSVKGIHSPAMVLFIIQLALNALWTPLFFGAKKLGAAFAEIICMWLAILGTILSAWPLSHTASYLLIPYLAWVSFASLLNFSLWKLNRHTKM